MERSYHAELTAIREKILLMAGKASEATRVAVAALEEWDIERADATVRMDDEIDQLENSIIPCRAFPPRGSASRRCAT